MRVLGTDGAQYVIVYKPTDGVPTGGGIYVWTPVGTQFKDGILRLRSGQARRHLDRDLAADLQAVYPTVGIQHVIRFGIRGDYDLDNLILYDENLSYLHADHLGSSSLATDADGGVISEMRYYPYGATRLGEMGTDRRYTGQRWESSVGLYDYNARFYDPCINRFVQADTIVPAPGNPQALNRYAYANNDPIIYTDPDGHIAILATAAIGAGVGTLIGAAGYYFSLENPQADFSWGEMALVAGTGAVAGGLIGTGVGAMGGASMLGGLGGMMEVSVAATHTSAGIGMTVSAGHTLLDNHQEGEDFHGGEFVVNSVGGAVDGAITAAIPGAGVPAAVLRAGTSGAINSLTYVAAEGVQGRVPTGQAAFDVMTFSTAGAFAGDMIGQKVAGQLVGNTSVGATLSMPPREYFRPVDMGYDMRGLWGPAMSSSAMTAQSVVALRDLGQEWTLERVFQPR